MAIRLGARLTRTVLAAVFMLLAAPAALAADPPARKPTDPPVRKPTDDDGIVDALEAFVWNIPATPVARQSGSAVQQTAQETAEAPSQYQWRAPLDAAIDQLVAGPPPVATDAIVPLFHFFPAEGENTYAWLNVPLSQSLEDGSKIVARMRPKEGNSDAAFSLGTDAIPFEVRQASNGVIAQAARTLPPGAYLLAIGTTDKDGKLSLRYAGEQRVARMPQGTLKLSSVILADALTQKADALQGPFQASGFEIVPRGTNVYKVGDTLRVFFVVLGAGAGSDGKASLDVSYQLYARRGGSSWQKAPKPYLLPGRVGAAQAWELPLPASFTGAEIKLEIQVKDNISGGQVTAPDLILSVSK